MIMKSEHEKPKRNRSSGIRSKACLTCGMMITGKPSRVAKRTYCSKKCEGIHRSGPNNSNWKGGSTEIKCAWCGKRIMVTPSLVGKTLHCSKECGLKTVGMNHRGENNAHWRGGRKAFNERRNAKRRAATASAPKTENPKKPTKERHPKALVPDRTCKKCGLPVLSRKWSYHPECRPNRRKYPSHFDCLDCGETKKVYPIKGVIQKRCLACSSRRKTGSRNPNWRGGISPENDRIRRSRKYKSWRNRVFNRDSHTCVTCGKRGGTLHAHHIKPFAFYPKLRFRMSNGRTLCEECHKKTATYLGAANKYRPKIQGKLFSDLA